MLIVTTNQGVMSHHEASLAMLKMKSIRELNEKDLRDRVEQMRSVGIGAVTIFSMISELYSP